MATTKTKTRAKATATKPPRTKMDAAKQKSLLESLTAKCKPELVEKINAIWELSTKDAADTIRKMWAVGKAIVNIDENQSLLESADGTERIDHEAIIASLFDKSESYVVKVRKLYKAFQEKKQLEELLGKRLAGSQRPLTWGHLDRLLSNYVPDTPNPVFDARLQMIIDKGMTARQFADWLKQQKIKAGARGSSGGRPRNVPPTVEGRMARFSGTLENLIKEDEDIYSHSEYGFKQTVMSMSQDEAAALLPKVTELIERSTQAVTKVIDMGNRKLREMNEVHAYLQQQASQRAEVSGREEAASLAEDEAEMN